MGWNSLLGYMPAERCALKFVAMLWIIAENWSKCKGKKSVDSFRAFLGGETV